MAPRSWRLARNSKLSGGFCRFRESRGGDGNCDVHFRGSNGASGSAELIGLRLFKACVGHELLLQIAVLTVTTVCSMFINDTAVVVIFLPVIVTVCKESHNLSPSRYLLWAAYGSLLGGQWTLIGTRSNIVISDFLRAETGRSFGFFDLTPGERRLPRLRPLSYLRRTKMASHWPCSNRRRRSTRSQISDRSYGHACVDDCWQNPGSNWLDSKKRFSASRSGSRERASCHRRGG